MGWIQWTLIVTFLVGLSGSGWFCKRYVKGVGDWLVAGRGCGKYLGATAGEAASYGAITFLGMLQMAYVAGPVIWLLLTIELLCFLAIAVTGWGIFRLRETRVLTINELLERRYSRRLRIFCGFVCFVSGVLNMGIFPIVTGRFITYFCQLPLAFFVFGLGPIPTLPLVTAVLVFVAVLLCVFGGQVSLVLTDFIQWVIMTAMIIAIAVAAYLVVNWELISQSIHAAADPVAMVNPLAPKANAPYGFWWLAMFTFQRFFIVLSWVPGSVRGQTATTPRESKLMWIMSQLRTVTNIGILFAGVACFAYMTLPAFTDQAEQILASLNGTSEQIKTQMVSPLFLAHIAPEWIKLLFTVGIIAASISTLDSYFLTWAGVFVQDVLTPMRGKKVSTEQHLRMLKWTVVGVATFVYLFSVLYKESDYISMYLALTGAIYTAGAGAVIFGALYWRRASTAGGWAAMIWGAGFAILGGVLQNIYGDADWWPPWLTGMALATIAQLSAIAIFVIVSVLTSDGKFNLEALLHRDGKDREAARRHLQWGTFEKVMAVCTAVLITAAIAGMVYAKIRGLTVNEWISVWKWYAFILFGYSLPITVWFFIGGLFDLQKLFARLRSESLDEADDGQTTLDPRP